MKNTIFIIILLISFGTLDAQSSFKWISLADKTATQSSTSNGGHAKLAIDGNTGGNFFDRSVTHTGLEDSPWWMIDLGEVYEVREVKVYNRTDCCRDRLDKISVEFLNERKKKTSDFGFLRRYETGQPNPLSLKMGVGTRAGRYVRIRKKEPGYLSLAEVKIYARKIKTDRTRIKVENDSDWHVYITPIYAGNVKGSSLYYKADYNRSHEIPVRKFNNKRLVELRVEWQDGGVLRKYTTYTWNGKDECFKADGKVLQLRGINIDRCN